MPRKKLPRRWSWETMWRTKNIPLTDEQIDEHIRVANEHGDTDITAQQIRDLRSDEVWTNATYTCDVVYLDPDCGRAGALHLSIKRRDRRVIHDWRDLQQIKNDCAGPEREALELYPAESRLIDTANQFHLWVAPEGRRLEVGWDTGRHVRDDAGRTGAVQRPRAQ